MMNHMKKNCHTNYRPLCALVPSISSSSTSSPSPIISIASIGSITISIDSIVNSDDEEGR